jgi:hypothetical protein
MEVGVERLHLEISIGCIQGEAVVQNGTLGWGQINSNRLEIVVIGFSFNENWIFSTTYTAKYIRAITMFYSPVRNP